LDSISNANGGRTSVVFAVLFNVEDLFYTILGQGISLGLGYLLKLGRAGRESVKEKFAPEIMVDTIEAVYQRMLGRDIEVVVAVTGGKLDFGLWEQIFYG